ncbi:MAG: hypothetical protein FWG22_00125 [Prolixibacteraceae bacterium]|nr:hypothetical protein [Prolixibacteraceae bacterium]
MKRFFSYSSLIVVLITGLAFINVHLPENGIAASGAKTEIIDEVSFPSEDIPFYAVYRALMAQGGLSNRISCPRLPVTMLNTDSGSSFMLKSYFSSIKRRQLSSVRTIYISFRSQKEKDGYYLYALRKLLI